MHKKDIWVGRQASSYLSHFKTILAIFKNKHTHTFQNILQNIEKHFQKTNIFVYILTNENHYKDFLNDGLISKYFQNHTKHHFKQNKAKQVI